MLKINKNKPIFYDEMIKNKKVWSDYLDKKDLKEHLVLEQDNMCAYCESKISKQAHIEHFYTRNLFPQLTFDYNNLFISCNTEKTCGKHKDSYHLKKDEFDEFYSPINIDINEFDYAITGELTAKTDKAQKTIDVFNLNHRVLIEKRYKIMKQINNYKEYLNFNLFNIFKEFKTFFIFIDKLHKQGTI